MAVVDAVAVFVSGCQLNIPASVSLLRCHFAFLKRNIIQIVCACGFALACAYKNELLLRAFLVVFYFM